MLNNVTNFRLIVDVVDLLIIVLITFETTNVTSKKQQTQRHSISIFF